jgi:chromosome segregation ATPase
MTGARFFAPQQLAPIPEKPMVWRQEPLPNLDHAQSARGQTEKVLSILRAAPSRAGRAEGVSAVDLVYQAAEMIKGVQDHAGEIEARAEELVRRAIAKLQASDTRIQSLEIERRASEAALNEATARIQEVEKVLARAQSRIAASESQLSAADLRARTAEARANEAEKALIRIEDAIRSQLLEKTRRPGRSAA